jgi:hypothetical protein
VAEYAFGKPGPYRRRILDRLRLSGAQLMRQTFDWASIEPRPWPLLFKILWGVHTGLLTVKRNRKPAYNAFVRAVRPLTLKV